MASLAWRNRVMTGMCVGAFLILTRMLIEDPWLRAERQYLFVITLGYGHLIGAAVFARQRVADLVPQGWPRRLVAVLVGLGVLDLFVFYAWATYRSPLVFVPLLVIAIWHVVENDLSLGRAYDARIGMRPVSRSPAHHVAAIAGTALLSRIGQPLLSPEVGAVFVGAASWVESGRVLLSSVALGAGIWLGWRGRGGNRMIGIAITVGVAAIPFAPNPQSGVHFGDFFSALTLYHLVQFLWLFADRIRAIPEPAARRSAIRRLAWVHVPAIVLCASLLLLPSDLFGTLRYAVFSPGIYLFWSVLHVVQTLVVRGLERPRPAGRAPAAAC